MRENEENLILKYQKTGNLDLELIEKNRGIINFVIRNYFRGFRDLKEDLEQEGVLGLIEAFKKYNPKKKAGFFVYKKLWVRKKIQLFVSKIVLHNSSAFEKAEHLGEICLGNPHRSNNISNFLDFLSGCGKISAIEKREACRLIIEGKASFLKSKIFIKLSKLASS